MKKLNYADYMNCDLFIKEEDEKIVLDYFNQGIEMMFDELGKIYTESGIYIADLKEVI